MITHKEHALTKKEYKEQYSQEPPERTINDLPMTYDCDQLFYELCLNGLPVSYENIYTNHTGYIAQFYLNGNEWFCVDNTTGDFEGVITNEQEVTQNA